MATAWPALDAVGAQSVGSQSVESQATESQAIEPAMFLERSGPAVRATAGSSPAATPTASPRATPRATPTPTAHRVVASTRTRVPVVRAAAPRPTPRPTLTPRPVSVTVAVPSVATARAYALSRIGSGQFACLDWLFTRESHWDPLAYNLRTGAYGIPQAVPAGKMAAAGWDWRINPLTQVKWGLSYIASAYGTACGAWRHEQSYGWY